MPVSVVLLVAIVVCVAGIGRKVYQYASTPAPLRIPLTPAPLTRTGVALRMLREVVLFASLFKASKPTWLFGWLFHAGLFYTLICHVRFFSDSLAYWLYSLVPYSPIASLCMVIGLSGLLARRIWVDRVRYISAPSDYLMLLLILSIAITGLLMRFVWYPDLVAVNRFAAGLLRFDPRSLPDNAVLYLHLLLVALLVFIFPFSKLLHAPGVFFSPSRNQVDNAREIRHKGQRINDG